MNLNYLNNCFKWNQDVESWEEVYLYKYQLDDVVFQHSKTIRGDACDIFTYNENYYMFPQKPQFSFSEALRGGSGLNDALRERAEEYKMISIKANRHTQKISFVKKITSTIKSLLGTLR